MNEKMKMKNENIHPYFMNSEKEKRLWETAIFVFDSSAILDFYFLPNKTRDKIYKKVFKELPERLWIPSHVEFEFLKNRDKIIGKPISEKYNPLKTKIQTIGKSFATDIQKRIDEISRETAKDDKHPHIDQAEIDLIKSQTKDFNKELKKFEESILDRVKKVEKEILDVKDNDDVLKAIEDYFQVGDQYSFNKILSITKEGDHRYQFKILNCFRWKRTKGCYISVIQEVRNEKKKTLYVRRKNNNSTEYLECTASAENVQKV